MNIEKKLSIGFINDICNKEYSSAKDKLAGMVEEKIKTRIKTIAAELATEEK